MYENLNILVLGAGKSGISAAKLLASKNNVTLTDANSLKEEDKKDLEALGVKIIITSDQLALLDDNWDLIVKNPAIMATSPIVKKINELGLNCENEMEVAYYFLPKDITIIGVTGSNGKTTTTTIIYQILKRSGFSVVLGGNIGYALCDVVSKVKSGDILLLEISDHQLCDFKDFKTNISVLTNIVPTHLDYHGTYEHYMYTKKRIFNLHTKEDLAIINKVNLDSMKITDDILSKKIYFNDDNNYIKDGYIYLNSNKVLAIKDIKLQGRHNYEDILMALIVLEQFKLDMDIVREFLQEFNGVEHRLEFVALKNGVEYYNDSKSTNPTATITALKTFTKPVHLILGGLERNQDFNELNNDLEYVKCIYAIGTVTDRVVDYASSVGIPVYKCTYLKNALEIIHKNALSGEVVLLSPGSSSQDFYPHFEDRGNEFKDIVNKF